ncbi:ABC transporter ATP-binding protein [Plantactinospora endophytica]|uniref:Multidrug ABC transporter permease n=1 Tax=Plantactinospora endophytica TaxID=673535 RepID=A0ABQ4DZX7_9ACTN|nr:ABC transporter ATP-binding protein [Plantactinospora endophytica]GIG88028.1 multidrug ABC transporter permease [Plantactinospora endophytica]
MTRWRTVGRQRLELLRLLSGTGRGTLTGLLLAHLVSALAPAATALAIGWLLTRALQAGSVGEMLPHLALVAVVVLTGQCTELCREPLDVLAARRIDGRLRSDLRRRVSEPRGISHLDDGEYGTDVARVSELGGWRTRTPGTGAVGQLVLLGRLAGAVGCAGVLAWYEPWLGVVLLTLTLLMRAVIRRQWVRLGTIWDARAGDRSRMAYWSDTLTGSAAAKEVRLFGFGGWLNTRHRAQAEEWLGEIWRERRGILRRQWSTFALAGGAGFAALYVPGTALAGGELTAGGLVTMVLAAWGVFAAGVMGHEAFDIEYATGALQAFERLRSHELATAGRATAEQEPGERPAPESAPHISFEGVGFCYPGTDRRVLDGLDLEIRPGEVLAVVGRNGAGKTTMLKVLAGLQQPTEGRVRVDGTDLAQLDVTSWRRRISAVFQDFVHYPLTVRENIALGAPEAEATDGSIMAAVEAAGAGDLVERLPHGLDTLLSREHRGGVDVSGGQWQKIAIARAMFAVAHGRRLLILDEPTAHLDVRAEMGFHQQVIAAVPDVSVVVISHRLSTVRNADRIVLLTGGRVTEAGDHGELMDLDGHYARLYRLQADRFGDGSTAVGAARATAPARPEGASA